MRNRFNHLRDVFARVLPRHVQKRLMRASHQFDFAAASYAWIPARAAIEDPDMLFAARFKGVIRLLQLVARDAHERLVALVPE